MKKLALTMALALALAVAFVAAASAADGKALFVKCAGCHGTDGAKTALGNKALKGLSAETIQNALKGYRGKTFGGPKKTIMEGMAGHLTDEEITALAAYISKL